MLRSLRWWADLRARLLRKPAPGPASLQRRSSHGALIVNPRSGEGKAGRLDLVEHAREMGLRTEVLDEGGDLERLARGALESGADALGAAGGDGSLAQVAQVAAEAGVPFVCIPTGTRNHFALDLGLDRDDPLGALSAFVDGEERSVDYCTVNGRMFLNNVALGSYAALVEQPSYRDAKLETAVGMLPDLLDGGGPWFDLSFDVPDHGSLDSAALLLVSNGSYDLRSSFGRRLRLDGGELSMLAIDPRGSSDLMSLTLLAMAGMVDRSEAFWSWSSPSFEVSSGQELLSAGLDGENVKLSTPLEFSAVPGGLRMLVPRGTNVGLAEQRGSSRAGISGLFEVAFGRPSK